MEQQHRSRWGLALSLALLLWLSIVTCVLWHNCFFLLTGSSIIFTYGGICGGRWLWKRFDFSETLSLYTNIIFTAGICLTIICLLFAIMSLFVYLLGNTHHIIIFISLNIYLMLISTSYTLGYVLSIWDFESITHYTVINPFKINWKLCFIIIKLTIFYIACVVSIFYLTIMFHILTDQSAQLLRNYFLCGIGAFIGWIIWEHLKQVISFKPPTFHRKLRRLSIIFLIIIGAISILAIIAKNREYISCLKDLSLIFAVLSYILGGYFVGLVYEIYQMKHAKEVR